MDQLVVDAELGKLGADAVGEGAPFGPSSASQSRTTAAVQDCSLEPSGSPENGSKYSAKPPSAI